MKMSNQEQLIELLVKENNDLKGKIGKYEKALKFYANKENYECDDESLNPAVSYIHIIDTDEGNEARKALGIEKE